MQQSSHPRYVQINPILERKFSKFQNKESIREMKELWDALCSVHGQNLSTCVSYVLQPLHAAMEMSWQIGPPRAGDGARNGAGSGIKKKSGLN